MTRFAAAFFLAQALFALGVLALRPAGASSTSSAISVFDPDPCVPRVPMRAGWTHIIVHHSASGAGSASHFGRIHRDKGWMGLGYHFVIGNGSMTEDGRVEAGERWVEQRDGAHAKPEWNTRAIGICLVGNFEAAAPTEGQMAALEGLCRRLCRMNGIPPGNVVGHGETHGNATKCPGKFLDLAGLRRRLEESP